MKTFYSVLGCDETLSQKDLKDKYFALIRIVHPDRNPDDDSATFTVAHKAWSVLRDPKSRADYDCWLQEQRLREAKQLVGQELSIDNDAEAVEADCRCGGWYEVDGDELARIVDFALFECSSCSLCLKIARV